MPGMLRPGKHAFVHLAVLSHPGPQMPDTLKSVDVQVGNQVNTLCATVRAVSPLTPDACRAEVC